ncbi:MAG: hypothetical protein AB7D27_11500 [Desulfomicrobium sp.]
MKREDWKKVEDLVNAGRSVLLRIEDRIITLRLERTKMKLVVGVYVDGAIKGIWCASESEHEESRFMYRLQRYVYSAKARKIYAEAVRKLGKRALKGGLGDIDPNAKRTDLLPWFPSVAKVRTQYEKTFKTIELVES